MATEPKLDRKQQILETLAHMLENPAGEKITTAALAAKLGLSEAALYRHFASKAQMFEGLIEFIELSIFGVINKIMKDETDGAKQVHLIVNMLLKFAEKNPGMTRVLIGDALVNEVARLQARMNQLYSRIETSLKQSLRIAEIGSDKKTDAQKTDTEAQANLLLCYVLGKWQLFVKSGFKKKPSEFAQSQFNLIAG